MAKKVRRLSDVVELQNKGVQTIDDVIILPLTPLIISGLFKIYCIIKLHSYLFLLDSINHIKSPNFTYLSSVIILLAAPPLSFRKFCPTVIATPLSIRTKPNKKLFKKNLFKLYFSRY